MLQTICALHACGEQAHLFTKDALSNRSNAFHFICKERKTVPSLRNLNTFATNYSKHQSFLPWWILACDATNTAHGCAKSTKPGTSAEFGISGYGHNVEECAAAENQEYLNRIAISRSQAADTATPSSDCHYCAKKNELPKKLTSWENAFNRTPMILSVKKNHHHDRKLTNWFRASTKHAQICGIIRGNATTKAINNPKSAWIWYQLRRLHSQLELDAKTTCLYW